MATNRRAVLVACVGLTLLAASCRSSEAPVSSPVSDTPTSIEATPTPSPIATVLPPPSPTAMPSQLPDADAAPTPTPMPPPQTDIRSVDFYDGFEFQVDDGELTWTVSNGSGTATSLTSRGDTQSTIQQVIYGDLDRNGVEDAVVVHQIVAESGETSGVVTGHRWNGSSAVSTGDTGMGEQPKGPIQAAWLANDRLFVHQFTESGCCPNTVVQSAWDAFYGDFTWDGSGRPIAVLSIPEDEPPPALTFLAEGNSAVITTDDQPLIYRFTFEAEVGQLLQVSAAGGHPHSALTVIDQRGDALATLEIGDEFELPIGGTISADIERREGSVLATSLIVSIVDPPSPDELVWENRTDFTANETYGVNTTLHYPVFSGGSNPAVVQHISDTIQASAIAWRDEWLESRGPRSREDRELADGHLSMSSNVTLAGPDLISVAFFWSASRLPELHPIIEQRGLIFDLNTGELLSYQDLILDGQTAFLDQLVLDKLSYQMSGSSTRWSEADPERSWDGLSIRPDGLLVTTSRGELLPSAATFGTRTLLSWAELSGIIDPQLGAQAQRTLAAVPVPRHGMVSSIEVEATTQFFSTGRAIGFTPDGNALLVTDLASSGFDVYETWPVRAIYRQPFDGGPRTLVSEHHIAERITSFATKDGTAVWMETYDGSPVGPFVASITDQGVLATPKLLDIRVDPLATNRGEIGAVNVLVWYDTSTVALANRRFDELITTIVDIETGEVLNERSTPLVGQALPAGSTALPGQAFLQPRHTDDGHLVTNDDALPVALLQGLPAEALFDYASHALVDPNDRFVYITTRASHVGGSNILRAPLHSEAAETISQPGLAGSSGFKGEQLVRTELAQDGHDRYVGAVDSGDAWLVQRTVDETACSGDLVVMPRDGGITFSAATDVGVIVDSFLMDETLVLVTTCDGEDQLAVYDITSLGVATLVASASTGEIDFFYVDGIERTETHVLVSGRGRPERIALNLATGSLELVD